MTTQNDLLLEHRLSELELELSRLRREVQRLTPAPASQAPAQGRYASPRPTTAVHQTRQYEFVSRIPTVAKIIDYRATDRRTGNVLTLDEWSAPQLERAAYKFAKLPAPTRSEWKGDRALFGAILKLFAHFGAIAQDPKTRKWSWGCWRHERLSVAKEIIASLTHK